MGAYPYISDLIFAITGVQIPLKIATFGFFLATALLSAIWIFGKEIERRMQLGYVPRVKIPDKTKKSEPQQKQKKKGKKNEKKEAPWRELTAKEIATNLGVLGGLTGIIGARLFHIFEYPEKFLNDPIAMLTARSGLTVLGGLLFGALASWWYCRRHKLLPMLSMLDAVAPAYMLGYAIGRVGCQLSGDGDWGIVANMALKPEWVPKLLWAQTYVGNVIGAEIAEPGVYPTPIYETTMCLILVGVLWKMRTRNCQPGWLFSWYLIFAGIERFLIEQIRVNSTYDWGFFQPTQAEIISVIMVAIGAWGAVKLRKSFETKDVPPLDPS